MNRMNASAANHANAVGAGMRWTRVSTLMAFFGESQADALTQRMQRHESRADASYGNEFYGPDRAPLTNPPSHPIQPTAFIDQRGDTTHRAGGIGLGGAARSAVFGGPCGILLHGDHPGEDPDGDGSTRLARIHHDGHRPIVEHARPIRRVVRGGELPLRPPGDELTDVGNSSFIGSTFPLTTPVIGIGLITAGRRSWTARTDW